MEPMKLACRGCRSYAFAASGTWRLLRTPDRADPLRRRASPARPTRPAPASRPTSTGSARSRRVGFPSIAGLERRVQRHAPGVVARPHADRVRPRLAERALVHALDDARERQRPEAAHARDRGRRRAGLVAGREDDRLPRQLERRPDIRPVHDRRRRRAGRGTSRGTPRRRRAQPRLVAEREADRVPADEEQLRRRHRALHDPARRHGTQAPDGRRRMDPAWSPSGRKIAAVFPDPALGRPARDLHAERERHRPRTGDERHGEHGARPGRPTGAADRLRPRQPDRGRERRRAGASSR